MLEKCSHSMRHYEHMCSLTLNGCAIETLRLESDFQCIPCDDRSHEHYRICTPSLIGT